MSELSWIEKLNLKMIDEEDGGCTIVIDWDENDPDLTKWTSWGEERQKSFVMDSLRYALDHYLTFETNGL